MASASRFPSEEEFHCSICLQVFTEPVTTPCGHNYCKTCITEYWATSGLIQCPMCMKRFRNKLQLQVNTRFRDMVEHFNNMRVRGEDGVLAEPGEVPCDICPGPQLKAQKTCLVCLASYCQAHLEPHRRVTTFKNHQLIDPVSDLEDRVCKRHNKMFELFCRMDQTCICFMCLKDDHATHEAVPLERAFREKKPRLDNVMSEIKMMENAKSRNIKEIRHSVEQSKKQSEKQIADVAEVFTALVVSLRASQVELIRLIQEKQEAAEKQAKDHVAQLEQEVAKLRVRRSEMEQLLQTEDHLRILQSYPSLCFPEHTGDLLDPLPTPPFTLNLSDVGQHSYVGMVKKAVAQMEKTLSNEMEMLIHEIRFSDGCEASKQPDAAEKLTRDEFIRELWSPPQDKLMMIQQCDAVDVTLDAYTAHSTLTVSEDGKQLRIREGRPFFPALFGRRFEHLPFILGKEGFSSGRFYYEVRVSGCKSWVLGVVKESFSRETFFLPIPEIGGWVFGGNNTQSPFQEEYYATGNLASFCLRQKPGTIGVFVDYEKGEVSFYDVDTRTLIFSYPQCTFMETTPALKAFLYSMAGTSLSNRPKLYPVFGIYGDDPVDILEITPVARN